MTTKITIPYISGDGIGPEIWQAAQPVIDAAVSKTNSDHHIEWKKVLAGGEAHEKTGEWLPDATIEAFKEYKVGIKCPLMTPVGGGIRSINVAIRKTLDLYACVRPVQWFTGVPSPVKHPEQVNMTIFRENTEDIYAGIEWNFDQPETEKLKTFLSTELGVNAIRFPDTTSLGIKPISKEGSERLIRAAITYAIKHQKPSVTIIHKGNIMKFTEGKFRDWGYELAEKEFSDSTFTWQQFESIQKEKGSGAAQTAFDEAKASGKVIIKDCIADAFFQNALLSPSDFSVVAATNLNGDYVSDALAAQVGGIGISPGANINYHTGHAVFEATHGTAPTIAGQNKANPCAVLLSAVMMLEHIGLNDASKALENAIQKTIEEKIVTGDFNMPNATIVGTKEMCEAIKNNL